jgi:hypothetical protein
VSSGSTVRDHPTHGGWGGDNAARGTGGDGERRGKITMPGELAMLAGHDPATGFTDPTCAVRAGRRGAAFVDQVHPDPGESGFVPHHLQGAADLPLP